MDLINDENFEKSLNMLDMVVWHSYKELHKNVLGKNVSENWKEIVDNFIQNMKDLGCSSMTIKMHMLFKHKKNTRSFSVFIRMSMVNAYIRKWSKLSLAMEII